MLGTNVPVDSPFNPLFVTNLQCRNIRISVTNQKSVISMELYDEHQPIEQFNSNIIVPVKSIHDTEYNDIKSDDGNDNIETGYNGSDNFNGGSTSTSESDLLSRFHVSLPTDAYSRTLKPKAVSFMSSASSSSNTYSDTWHSDMQSYMNVSTLKVPTLTSGDVNYLVGIISNHLKG